MLAGRRLKAPLQVISFSVPLHNGVINCRHFRTNSFASKLKSCWFGSDVSIKKSFSSLKHISKDYLAQTYRNVVVRSTKNSFKFYQKCYHNFNTKKLISTVFKRLPPGRPLCTTFAAAACTFSWEDNEITNMEVQAHVDELKLLEKQSKDGSFLPHHADYKNLPDHWLNILDEPNIKIWQLPYKESGMMQYKVLGRFSDISARQFFAVQADLDYRRKWDELVINISVVDENKKTDEQVVRWISYFPYPFKSREYVYIRKAKVLEDQNMLVIISRSVDHPNCKTDKQHIRVPLYISEMVIKPHKHFDEPGLDYLLTYCDNPQTSIPTRLSSWVVTKGIPDYINKLHKAALKVHEVINTSDSTSHSQCENTFEINLRSYTGNTVKAY